MPSASMSRSSRCSRAPRLRGSGSRVTFVRIRLKALDRLAIRANAAAVVMLVAPMGSAPRAGVSEHPSVRRALASTLQALEQLLVSARAEGHVRRDATILDLRLLFATTRAAGELEPGAWRRMLELVIRALEAGAPPAPTSVGR